MPFVGFTLLRDSATPPELLELLPELDSLAELKVTLCLLAAHSRAAHFRPAENAHRPQPRRHP